MKINQGLTGLVLLCTALGAGRVQATVEVRVPDNFRILAVSNGKLDDKPGSAGDPWHTAGDGLAREAG